MVYEDYTSSFEDLLTLDGSVTIHHRNIQKVAVEMFKIKNGLCPEIMKDLFHLKGKSTLEKVFLHFLLSDR